MIFLFTSTISSKTIKIKSIKKIDSRNKIQFLNVDNFEIVLKYLNFDDLPHFLRACEKSKSNFLKQTILKLFQIFHKKQIQKSIEYVRSEIFHTKKKSTKFFEKYLNSKPISLPKFVDHVIQTTKFRIISHNIDDGFFSIEQKLEKQKQYSITSIEKLLSQSQVADINYMILVKSTFSFKHFITIILNHYGNIFMIFKEGQIFICGKTGKVNVFFQSRKLHPIYHFISKKKVYLMSYGETNNNFFVYHISSGEIFCFENSLKFILLNPNSDLDYDFLKNNGKSSEFLKEQDDFLLDQMTTDICLITSDSSLNPNRFKEILNEIYGN
jgi:hypothetical protein